MKKFDRKVGTYNRYINDYLDYKNKTLKDRLNYLNSNPNLKPELLDIAQRIHSQKYEGDVFKPLSIDRHASIDSFLSTDDFSGIYMDMPINMKILIIL